MSQIEISPRLPLDPHLPGLTKLLDSRQFARAVSHLLPAGSQVTGCRPLYVRYKPGTNAIAAFEVEIDGHDRPLLLHGKCHPPGDYELARDKAATGRWIEPVLGLPFAVCDKDQLLLFAFPNDQALDGLRLAANPRRLQRALYAHEPDLNQHDWRVSDSRMTIRPVRFKPEKRAVLRIDTRAIHRERKVKKPVRVYARVNRGEQGTSVAALMTRLSLEFADHPLLCTPRVIVYLEEERTTLVADMGGQPLAVDESGVASAGRVLAYLHPIPHQGLPTRDSRSILASVEETVTTIANLAPELEHEAWILFEKMRLKAGDHMDDRATDFVHGDYHPQQILDLHGRTALLDFDRSYSGDSKADLGNYTAHLIFGDLVSGRNQTGWVPLRDSLVQAYRDESGGDISSRDLSFWTALGLMQLAPTPFRVLNREWPQILAATLAACRKELSWD